MEQRLGAALHAGGGRQTIVEKPPAPSEDSAEAVAATLPNGANVWPDEAAEVAFLSEARERGEPVAAAKPAEVADETDTKSLPPLDSLVKRLSPEVRETLDELFRARFITVRRVPKKALKN